MAWKILFMLKNLRIHLYNNLYIERNTTDTQYKILNMKLLWSIEMHFSILQEYNFNLDNTDYIWFG